MNANELESLKKTNAELLLALRECADALAYAAFNYDGSKLEGLKPNLVESTGVSDTALIAERRARNLLEAHRTPAANAGGLSDELSTALRLLEKGFECSDYAPNFPLSSLTLPQTYE